MSEKTLKLIKETDARWVDLRFTDSHGKEQHVTNNVDVITEDFFETGAMFDGSIGNAGTWYFPIGFLGDWPAGFMPDYGSVTGSTQVELFVRKPDVPQE